MAAWGALRSDKTYPVHDWSQSVRTHPRQDPFNAGSQRPSLPSRSSDLSKMPCQSQARQRRRRPTAQEPAADQQGKMARIQFRNPRLGHFTSCPFGVKYGSNPMLLKVCDPRGTHLTNKSTYSSERKFSAWKSHPPAIRHSSTVLLHSSVLVTRNKIRLCITRLPHQTHLKCRHCEVQLLDTSDC